MSMARDKKLQCYIDGNNDYVVIWNMVALFHLQRYRHTHTHTNRQNMISNQIFGRNIIKSVDESEIFGAKMKAEH